MEDEIRELPYHNKPAWLHHAWPIKFHTAVKPGVKMKRDNDARNKNNEKYEANRKWLFLSSWATERHRLQNDDEKGMTCKFCVEHYGDKLNLQGSSKKHLFIAGFKNYKISTVSDHEKSCVHIDAVKSNRITITGIDTTNNSS